MSERAFSSEYVYMGEWASAQSGPVRHARAAAIYSVFSSFLFPLSADVCPSLSLSPSLPLLSSVLLLLATSPASPLPVSQKESGGHETGGGATDARL